MARAKKEKEVVSEKTNEQLEITQEPVTQEILEEVVEEQVGIENEVKEDCNKNEEVGIDVLDDDVVIKIGDKVISLDEACDGDFTVGHTTPSLVEEIRKVLNETVTYDLETLSLIKKIRDIID